jgi:hypothetical protein
LSIDIFRGTKLSSYTFIVCILLCSEYELILNFSKLPLLILTIEDDIVKGSKHVAITNYTIKTNIDTIVSYFVLFMLKVVLSDLSISQLSSYDTPAYVF